MAVRSSKNNQKIRYGALPEEWGQLDILLGLGAYLLPVVANPNATISKQSTIKHLGKTPSVYNGRREVVGIANWTTKQTKAMQLDQWSHESDYGICIRTGEVCALDIDVDDELTVLEIIATLAKCFPWIDMVPKRWRVNSGKILLAFLLPGDYRKRILKVDGGIIEFLANGQQFVAHGTHISGARLNWVTNGEEGYSDFPMLSPEMFEALWGLLEKKFGISQTVEAGGARRRGPNLNLPDSILNYLHSHGLVIGGNDERVDIECPWAHEHTDGSGNDSSTSYFPAGTNKYEQGHFACLHAHCTHRKDGDFINALGVYMDEIENLGLLPIPFNRERLTVTRNKAGQILNDIGNVVQMLARNDQTGWLLAQNNLNEEFSISEWKEGKDMQWRPMRDSDYTMLSCILTEKLGFKQIPHDVLRRAVWLVAERNSFDSGIDWGNSLSWDGIPRIDKFLSTYFGAEDNDYHLAVSAYMWTAMAGRLMQPGVQADMVPVLVGKQGSGKSRGVAALVCKPEFYGTIDLMARDADMARVMRGKLVLEIGELRGLHGREMEAIKDFITRSEDTWIPKYKEYPTRYKRRCLMIGTTNQQEFLADRTGNRRWLPVKVGQASVKNIEADRQQLWAEGIARFKANGVEWKGAECLAENEHQHYRVHDAQEERIAVWLETADETAGTRPSQRRFTMLEVLRDALHLDSHLEGKGIEMKVAKILREYGYETKTARVSGIPRKVWQKK